MDQDRLAVVLVHGFASKAKTWKCFDERIAEDDDLKMVDVLHVQYSTRIPRSVWWLPHRRLPTLSTIADVLQTFLESEIADYRKLVLVCHSMGGLVVQRYLQRMLNQGRGLELARIRRIVLFATPNAGSDFARSLRSDLLGSHPQEKDLRTLNEEIRDTHAAVIRDVVNADKVSERTCPIPFSVYAGADDNIVPRASAQGSFPTVGALPGDHFSIIKPDSRSHGSYTTLRRLLLEAAADSDPPGPATVTAYRPVDLEVHQAPFRAALSTFVLDSPLTPYLARKHDQLLSRTLRSVLDGGPSRLIVLTGESSTGKTRSLYEAVQSLAPDRLLLKPVTAADLVGILDRGDADKGAVIWLNEAQRFLYGADGELAAARLQEHLQKNPGIAALATLWVKPYWVELAEKGRTDPSHMQAAALLNHPAITLRLTVPSELVAEDNARWQRLARDHGDQRMSDAWSAGRSDGRIIQQLSGGPELLAAYLDGPGVHFTHQEHALITAALDARRLGYLTPIPGALLASAAEGALAPRHRSSEAHWASPVLQDLASGQRSDGTPTAIRASTALIAIRAKSGQPALYEPDDYLDQQTRLDRANCRPTASLWQALLDHTADSDALHSAAQEAWSRGLRKHAFLLWRKAIRAGHLTASVELARRLDSDLDPHRDAMIWIASNACLSSARTVTRLIQGLDRAGLSKEADGVATRAASDVNIADAQAVSQLLQALVKTRRLNNVDKQFAERAVDHLSLVHILDPKISGELLRALRQADLVSIAQKLAQRLSVQIERVNLASPRAVSRLLKEMREAGQNEACQKLTDRITQEELADPRDTAQLIREMSRAGRQQQIAHLAQLAREADTSNPRAIAQLLQELRKVGMAADVDYLAQRANTANLANPRAVAQLLKELRRAGKPEVTDYLARRIPDDTDLTFPSAVAELVGVLWQGEQTRAAMQLIHKFALQIEQADLSSPQAINQLVRKLGQMEIPEREIILGLVSGIVNHFDSTNPRAAELIQGLQRAGFKEAARRLARRVAGVIEHVELSSPHHVAHLLQELRRANEHQAVHVLKIRAEAAGMLIEDTVRQFGWELDGQPASPWDWGDLPSV